MYTLAPRPTAPPCAAVAAAAAAADFATTVWRAAAAVAAPTAAQAAAMGPASAHLGGCPPPPVAEREREREERDARAPARERACACACERLVRDAAGFTNSSLADPRPAAWVPRALPSPCVAHPTGSAAPPRAAWQQNPSPTRQRIYNAHNHRGRLPVSRPRCRPALPSPFPNPLPLACHPFPECPVAWCGSSRSPRCLTPPHVPWARCWRGWVAFSVARGVGWLA